METARRAVPQIPFNNLLYQTGRGRKCPPTSGITDWQQQKSDYYNFWDMNSENL
jgi:hypothetical protein